MTQSLEEVATHRGVALATLSESLVGFAEVAQSRWLAWRRKMLSESTTPEQFATLLESVISFADEPLTDAVGHKQWNPVRRSWEMQSDE